MAVSNSFSKGKRRAATRKPSESRRQGATGRKNRVSDFFHGYLRHHQHVFRDTFVRLWKDPVQTLMTALVIAIALGLPAALYVAVVNLQQVGSSVRDTGEVSVFLKLGAELQAVTELRELLAAEPEVDAVSYISPSQALEEFKEVSGFGEVLNLLDENPLPAVLLIRYHENASVQDLQALKEKLRSQPLIDDVRVDLEWVQRLYGMLEIARKVTLSLGLALSLGVLLIIGNTIRLAIENRRDEIIVVKLVGGTDSYVRRPFLYTGLWYGLLGGLLAWLMVTGGLFWLDDTIDRLARLYQSGFSLRGLGFQGLLSLLIIGVTLGLLGASIAVSKHLAALEPR